MSQMSKFINLLMSYSQKICPLLHKKYRNFVRSILNLQILASTVNSHKVLLTHEIIIFKLGLESKSIRAIQISLFYLHKLFQLKFINLNEPNYCQYYIIQENNVKHQPIQRNKQQIYQQIIRLLQPLRYYKNIQICQMVLKIYQYLIGQHSIIQSLLDIAFNYPSQLAFTTVFNFYSYRLILFEQTYLYKLNEISSIEKMVIFDGYIEQEVQNLLQKQQKHVNLIKSYVQQIVDLIVNDGGKYGRCVICKQSANYYCKITHAALCSLQCRNKHSKLIQQHSQNDYQALILQQQIYHSINLLLEYLCNHESQLLFTILVRILKKPHLFMIIRLSFRELFGKKIPSIINKIFQYKNEGIFENIYNFLSSLIRYWMQENKNYIQFFYQESILKILENKKPNFKMIVFVFKVLAYIFQYGKTTLELFINFDCQCNYLNLFQRVMFQLSRICQDKLQSNDQYTKQQQIIMKNSCITIFIIIAKGLNNYRLQYKTNSHNVIRIIKQKHNKYNIQKFILRFNTSWKNGIKQLFNLQLITLQQSNEQIINIIRNVKGLKKNNIVQMLLFQDNVQLLEIFIKEISSLKNQPLLGLIEIHRFIPLKYSSIFVQKLLQKLNNNCNMKQIDKYLHIITQNSLQKSEIISYLPKNLQNNAIQIQQIYKLCLQCRIQLTTGSTNKNNFIYCKDSNYLLPILQQLNLLEIPICYLLENLYCLDRLIQLIGFLIEINPNINWLNILLKKIDLNYYQTQKISNQVLILLKGVFQIVKKSSIFIKEWSHFLYCICKVQIILSNGISPHKFIDQNKKLLSNSLNITCVEEVLLEISYNLQQQTFINFILAILNISEQQLKNGNCFMLQKFLIILDINIEKYLNNFQIIFQSFYQFTLKLNHQNTQTYIYIANMLKQSIAKLLKIQVNQKIQNTYFELLCLLLKKQNNEVKDFIINCLSMIIMHNYELHKSSWRIICFSLKQYAFKYNQQILIIINKIVLQNLFGCEQCIEDIINVCLIFIQNDDICKNNIELLHLIQKIMHLYIQLYFNKSKKQLYSSLFRANKQLSIQQEKNEQNSNQLFTTNQKQKQKLKQQQKQELKQKQEQKEKLNQNQQKQKLKQNQYKQKQKQKQKQELNQNQKQKQKQNQSYNENEKQDYNEKQKLKQKQNQKYNKKQNQKQKQNKNKSLLIKLIVQIIQQLTKFLHYKSHQTLIQTILIFLNIKIRNEQYLLNKQYIDFILTKIFEKLNNFTLQSINKGEKIINQILYWCVKHQQFSILKHLEHFIIQKYSPLSYTACKCIQTYIQMTNPKDKAHWQPIEGTLIRIIKDTRISKLDKLSKQKNLVNELIEHNGQKFECESILDCSLQIFISKMIIQKLAVELIPNDSDCLGILKQIYQDVQQFNDNITIRVQLWKQGLGNIYNPPNMLKLEQKIINRIMSIYQCTNNYNQMFNFGLIIFQKYIQVSEKYYHFGRKNQFLKNKTNLVQQLLSININYWFKKKILFMKIIDYLLPKLSNLCYKEWQKRKILSQLIAIVQYVDRRDPFLKTIKQLSGILII